MDEKDDGLNEANEGRHFRFWLREREKGCEGDDGGEKGGRYRRRSSPAGYPPPLPLSPSIPMSLSSREVSISWNRSSTVRSLR